MSGYDQRKGHTGTKTIFRGAFALAALLFFAITFANARDTKGKVGTFTGEITDEHLNCMQKPMKATSGVDDKTSCVLYWAHFVQPLSKFVLYDPARKTTYQVENQDKVEPFAGEKVRVTGTLDPETRSITVTEIKVP